MYLVIKQKKSRLIDKKARSSSECSLYYWTGLSNGVTNLWKKTLPRVKWRSSHRPACTWLVFWHFIQRWQKVKLLQTQWCQMGGWGLYSEEVALKWKMKSGGHLLDSCMQMEHKLSLLWHFVAFFCWSLFDNITTELLKKLLTVLWSRHIYEDLQNFTYIRTNQKSLSYRCQPRRHGAITLHAHMWLVFVIPILMHCSTPIIGHCWC